MAEQLGLGTEFQRESATPGVFDTIAYVAGITPPQITVDDVEVDDLDPPDAYKKYLPGLLDGGEVSLTLNFDGASAGHVDLLTDANGRTVKNFKIVLPDTSTWAFSGYVKGFAPSEIVAGEVMQAEVTMKVTGKPNFTAA